MRLLLSLAAAAVLSLSPSAAFAATPSTTGDYCAVRVDPVGSDAPPASPACFGTQDEVDAYLAGVTAQNRSLLAASSVVLGTVYRDSGYGGGSYTFYGAGPCSGVTYGFPSLSSDWQNTISSAKAYASCWVTLYDAASYGGSRYNCTPNCASLPAFNDRTESLVFRPAGTLG
ncbi:hypothetical protein [uncultured Leifsonia sp.]|uniref:hypothetical protein n=1 Tax=Leifsonia sp. TaxID=1870902 RepID=UPI0028D5FBAD|nr:hypothetical protein [uncultured Leifsonia sp.]